MSNKCPNREIYMVANKNCWLTWWHKAVHWIWQWCHESMESTSAACWCWWCNGVRKVFLALFGPLSLNTTVCLSIAAEHVHGQNGIMAKVDRLLLPPWPPLHHVTKKLISWIWQWVQLISAASPVTRSGSSRAHLGCGRAGDWRC